MFRTILAISIKSIYPKYKLNEKYRRNYNLLNKYQGFASEEKGEETRFKIVHFDQQFGDSFKFWGLTIEKDKLYSKSLKRN